MVEKSGRKPEEHALHPLRIGSASMRAARGDVSARVIQREGRLSPMHIRCTHGVMRTMHDRCLVN